MEKIDIVIPLGTGSTWNDNELRYCLRSIEKYGKNYNNIIIIGECPKWIKNIKQHVTFPDNSSIPSKNIQSKLLVASSISDTSNNFIYFNDDYFLLNDYDFSKVPYYHSINLEECVTPNNWYNEYLLNTKTILEKASLKTINYDVHYPMIINKKDFIQVYNKFKIYWDIDSKILVKSLYGNFVSIISPDFNTKKVNDCKIRGTKTLDAFNLTIRNLKRTAGMFSIGDLCLSEQNKEYIMKLYPEKSKYED